MGIILLLAVTFRLCRRRSGVSGAYGTARQSGLSDLLTGKLLSDHGLILASVNRLARPTKGQALRALLSPFMSSQTAVRMCLAASMGVRRIGDFIRINDFVHIATFAPAGAGKSVSVLVPNLLSYRGNCVVIDPKGELYKLTAKHRKKEIRAHDCKAISI